MNDHTMSGCPQQFVPVLETHNAGDRAFLRSILDAENIDYFIQGETVAPYLLNALPMRVMVRCDQAESVRSLLEGIVLSYSYVEPYDRDD